MDFNGISNAISVGAAGHVADVAVALEVQHTYIGDLEIDLVAPSGRRVRLHDREGNGRNDINRMYDIASTPALEAMVGQSVEGDWTLQLRDLAPADAGTLRKWTIRLSH